MRPRLLLTINCKFAVDFFARGLHARTAVARLPLRQLGFLVVTCLCNCVCVTYINHVTLLYQLRVARFFWSHGAKHWRKVAQKSPIFHYSFVAQCSSRNGSDAVAVRELRVTFIPGILTWHNVTSAMLCNMHCVRWSQPSGYLDNPSSCGESTDFATVWRKNYS